MMDFFCVILWFEWKIEEQWMFVCVFFFNVYSANSIDANVNFLLSFFFISDFIKIISVLSDFLFSV